MLLSNSQSTFVNSILNNSTKTNSNFQYQFTFHFTSFTYTPSSQDRAAIMEPLVEILLNIFYPTPTPKSTSTIQDKLRCMQQDKHRKNHTTINLKTKGGALVKYQPQDDNLEETVNRIEDREYFFNDMFSCVSAELQELQAWVNNLDSEVSSLVNKDSHIEDEWVNNNPFQIDSWIPTVNEVDSLESNNPQIEDWDNIFDGSAIPDQIMAQLADSEICNEDDTLDNLSLWFTSQAKSECDVVNSHETNNYHNEDEWLTNNPFQLEDWDTNTHGETTSKQINHYRVSYGGKVLAGTALVEGVRIFAWALGQSGSVPFTNSPDLHTCMSKQAKKALSL